MKSSIPFLVSSSYSLKYCVHFGVKSADLFIELLVKSASDLTDLASNLIDLVSHFKLYLLNLRVNRVDFVFKICDLSSSLIDL